MKRKEVKKRLFFVSVFLIFSILIASSLVSANIMDWFKKTITGRVGSQTTDVSISISGTNPVTIDWVWNQSSALGTSNDPTERGVTTININVTVTDIDGVSDINDSSVRGELINGTFTIVNETCADLGEETTNSANYSCSFDLYYFYTAGPWIINITANDLGNKDYVSNYSETFFYDVLLAIEITPGSLTWTSVSPGAENQTSNNDPTLINNTGNYNATGNVAVTGIDLYGVDGINFIGAGNLTAATVTGDSCSGASCIECNQELSTNSFVLENGTDKTITSIVLEAGNLTDDPGNTVVSNASLWYCLFNVPSILSSQTYSTSNTGSQAWTIKLV